MLDPETNRKVRELAIPGFLEALDMVSVDSLYSNLSFEEKLKIVIDYSYQEKTNNLVKRLIRNAHLRLPQADLSNIDYENRPLKREQMLELGTSQYVTNCTDIIIEGFTGTGKSFLACSLGKQACKHEYKTLYIRMPDMLAYWQEKIDAGCPEKKVLNKFSAYKVLILDEFLIDTLNSEQMHFLLELTERRYDNSSTIYCSQYGLEEWHRRMGSGAHAEAVLDRITHNSIRIKMGEVNMRKRLMKKQQEQLPIL